jgi:hypothetical protein
MAGARALFPEESDGAVPAAAPPVADARTAMLLLRASTLQMLRLQLAMERSDRAVALQSVDDLIALDAHMAALLETAPLDPMLRELDEQKTILMREKFGLAAGLKRRPAQPVMWPAQPTASGPPAAPEPTTAPGEDELPVASAHRARWPVIVAAIFLLMLVAAIGAIAIFGWPPATFFTQGDGR